MEVVIEGPKPEARADHSVVVIGDCLVVFDGIDYDAGNLVDLWILNFT